MTKDLNQKYGMNPPHSEVVAACQVVEPGNALDMGCSSGRNALYLAERGFTVTAVDTNTAALGQLQSIIAPGRWSGRRRLRLSSPV